MKRIVFLVASILLILSLGSAAARTPGPERGNCVVVDNDDWLCVGTFPGGVGAYGCVQGVCFVKLFPVHLSCDPINDLEDCLPSLPLGFR